MARSIKLINHQLKLKLAAIVINPEKDVEKKKKKKKIDRHKRRQSFIVIFF